MAVLIAKAEPRAVFFRRAVVAELVEIHAVRAGVAEYAVEHDADAAFARGLTERFKILFLSEQRIDAGVVRRVVPVVARRLKDRVQVQNRYAERGEIRQLFLDAPERSAPERPRGDVSVFRAGVEHRGVPVAHEKTVRAAPRLRLARRPAALAGKAVGENLIDDAVLPPVGDGGFVVYRELPCAGFVIAGEKRVPEHARRFGQRHRDGKPPAALGGHGEERVLAGERVQPERHVRRARLFRGEIYFRPGFGGAERTAEGAVSGFMYDHVKRPR